MGHNRIADIKITIENALKSYLYEEGLALYVAANDNAIWESHAPAVSLESLEDAPLRGSALLSEIRVTLRLQSKPWQCDALVRGLYQALQPHWITPGDLTILLMSLHVDIIDIQPRRVRKRALMCYIVEETPVPADHGLQLQLDMAGS